MDGPFGQLGTEVQPEVHSRPNKKVLTVNHHI